MVAYLSVTLSYRVSPVDPSLIDMFLEDLLIPSVEAHPTALYESLPSLIEAGLLGLLFCAKKSHLRYVKTRSTYDG